MSYNHLSPLNNEPPPLSTYGSNPVTVGDIKDIGAEAYICVYGRNPKMDGALHGLIKCARLASSISDIQGVLTGGYSSASSLTKMAIEGAFSPSNESLAQSAYNVQQRNLGQNGYNLFVRVTYKEYADGWFSDGWEEKNSEWAEWKHNGYDDLGSFESIRDINTQIVSKAMRWIVKSFVEKHK